FDSGRSHHFDQLKFLGEKCNMNYAYVTCWSANYIPYPYWPIRKHFGKMLSGGGILSRFPIVNNEVFLHKKPAANSWWYNLFYLYRFTQIATIKIAGKEMAVANNHLEAFNKKNRRDQAKTMVKRLNLNKDVLAAGGDFNTTPPNATRKSGFEGYPKDDYEDDSTYESLVSGLFLKDALKTDDYLREEKRWFTFSSVKPSRKLDYIFVKEDIPLEEFEVIQTPVSDHFPVQAKIRLIN
ncbi:MAG: endonuclease/exonuclease/phosphatase family protein, partial [Bacteriovoracaceae bacterium]